MPNQPGDIDHFDYQEALGVNRTAWLTKTYWDPQNSSTHNSEWIIKKSENSDAEGPYSQLTVLGVDGNQWNIKTHCTFDPGFPTPHPASIPTINVKFEGQDSNTGTNDPSILRVVDWDGSKWDVVVHGIWGTEGQPTFRLIPV